MDLDRIDPEMRRAARFMPAPPVHRRWTLPVMRWLTKVGVRHKLSSRVTVEVRPVGAASVHIYRPPERPPTVAVLWIHGGGFVIGTAQMDDVRCSRYALEFGAVVVSVDYRLAPEHPFPAPLDDCFAAWTGCRSTAERPRRGPTPHRGRRRERRRWPGGDARTAHPRHRWPAAGGAAARLPDARRPHRRPHRRSTTSSTACGTTAPTAPVGPPTSATSPAVPKPTAPNCGDQLESRPPNQSPSTPSGRGEAISPGLPPDVDRRRRGRPVPRRGPRLRRATRGRGRTVRVRRRAGSSARLRQHGTQGHRDRRLRTSYR